MNREDLRYVVITLSDSLRSCMPGIITFEMLALMDQIKTQAYYQHTLERNVRLLYSGKMNENDFVNDLVRLIDEQFTRAWNEAMREQELDPVADMTDEWAQMLDARKVQELDYVEAFAGDVVKAAQDGKPVESVLSRVSLWSNRYNEVLDMARRAINSKQRLKWKLGKTEQHCASCAYLNGIVAYAEEWDNAGLHPQGAPNDRLECGGWKCDCSLEPTNERRTRDALDKIMNAPN